MEWMDSFHESFVLVSFGFATFEPGSQPATAGLPYGSLETSNHVSDILPSIG